MNRSVWILCLDGGYEGLGEPFIAFETEHAAFHFQEAANNLYAGNSKIIEAKFFDAPPAPPEMPDE